MDIKIIYNLNQNFIPQDEVAHTLTENRVLRTMVHPFLTVSCYMFHLYLIINFDKMSTNQNYNHDVDVVCEHGVLDQVMRVVVS